MIPANRLPLIAAALVAVGTCCVSGAVCAADSGAADADASRSGWFQQARFGMFIHWGVYSVLGRGEWVMHNENIPVTQYETNVPQFKAENYNPDEWVRLAKEAGMKYMVLTSKHHDGFCMFDSALTDYDAVDRGPHRDLAGALANACRRQHMPLMFYYSLMDWHHPLYPGDLPHYTDYAFGQVRELLTKYHPAGIWFDGEWDHPAPDWRSPELVAMIRQIAPRALVNDRLGQGERRHTLLSDFYCAEQLPEIQTFYKNPPARPWEACMTIGEGHWGYSTVDRKFKSPAEIIRTLATAAGAGGNLLLNVGPRPDGTIQPEFVQRLREVGKWMKVNGRSIYGTQAGLPPDQTGVISTRSGNVLYVHIWDERDVAFTIKRLPSNVLSVTMLAGNKPLEFNQEGQTLIVKLPQPLSDRSDTVLRVVLSKLP